MKNHGFSRLPKSSWEIWVSIHTYPLSYVQAYSRWPLAEHLAVVQAHDQRLADRGAGGAEHGHAGDRVRHRHACRVSKPDARGEGGAESTPGTA